MTRATNFSASRSASLVRENLSEDFRPFEARSLRNLLLVLMLDIARAVESVSSGSKNRAASETISGMLALSLHVIGIPQVIASSNGIPKPSYSEGDLPPSSVRFLMRVRAG